MKRIALGTAQFGMNYGIANRTGKVRDHEIASILDTAASSGCDTLDTAPVYGDSEKILGNYGVSGWKVISKIPSLPPDLREVRGYVTKSVEESLKNLKIPSLHTLMVHNSKDVTGDAAEELFHVMGSLKNEKLIENMGVSVYDPINLNMLCARFAFDVVQAPLNLIDRRFLDSIPTMNNAGIQVHLRSIFLQGLLLIKQEDLPKKFQPWISAWLSFHNWLRHEKLTALRACLGFALSIPGISKIIVGVDSAEQFEQIRDAVALGSIDRVPADIQVSDERFVNPTNWETL